MRKTAFYELPKKAGCSMLILLPYPGKIMSLSYLFLLPKTDASLGEQGSGLRTRQHHLLSVGPSHINLKAVQS